MKKFLFLTTIIITLLTGCCKKPLLGIHIIDVGQGDSILIQTPGNKNILVDGGDEDSSLIIKKFLSHKKVKKLDFINVIMLSSNSSFISFLIKNKFSINNSLFL